VTVALMCLQWEMVFQWARNTTEVMLTILSNINMRLRKVSICFDRTKAGLASPAKE
jgi:hypothetical protein